MLTMNDLKIGVVVSHEGDPYQVVQANFVRMQQRKPVMQTKLKNLINGKVIEINYHPGDKIEEADLARRKTNYMYKDDANLYLMDNDSYEQFSMDADVVGDKVKFMKEGEDVDVLYFEGKPVNISLPIKIALKVVEAPPGIKGDTAQGGTKQVTLETGAVVNAPLFIKEGEMIRVNTETGEYVERA